MSNLRTTSCCGIRDFEGLHTDKNAEKSLRQIGRDWFRGGRKGVFVFFSGTTRNKYGEKLTKLIEKESLGSVFVTEPKSNPNSGNTLKMWLWTVDTPKLKKWWMNSRKEKMKGFVLGAKVKWTPVSGFYIVKVTDRFGVITVVKRTGGYDFSVRWTDLNRVSNHNVEDLKLVK